jgi:hypothetical protein
MHALQPCTVHAVKNPTAAGVCHLNIHQSNVFFRVKEEEEVLVKEVIDFDFVFPKDHPLSNVFVDTVQQTQNAYPKDISGNLPSADGGSGDGVSNVKQRTVATCSDTKPARERGGEMYAHAP